MTCWCGSLLWLPLVTRSGPAPPLTALLRTTSSSSANQLSDSVRARPLWHSVIQSHASLAPVCPVSDALNLPLIVSILFSITCQICLSSIGQSPSQPSCVQSHVNFVLIYAVTHHIAWPHCRPITCLSLLQFGQSCWYSTESLSVDSDSDEEEQFYSTSESARRKKALSRPDHALSLLCITVLIGKGRVQAMTDSKVSQSDSPVTTFGVDDIQHYRHMSLDMSFIYTYVQRVLKLYFWRCVHLHFMKSEFLEIFESALKSNERRTTHWTHILV